LATQNATNLINALTLLSPGSDLEKDTELQVRTIVETLFLLLNFKN
jgi:hypothetical protein